MSSALFGPLLHGHALLIFGVALALAYYLERWKKNHK